MRHQSKPSAAMTSTTLDCRIRARRGAPQRVEIVVRGSSGPPEKRTRPKRLLDALRVAWLAAGAYAAPRAKSLGIGKRLYALALGWSALAQAAAHGPLSIRLRVAREVADLPWELLAHREFILLRAGSMIVRHQGPRDPQSEGRPPRPWRVLVACAATELDETGLRAEIQAIVDAAEAGGIAVSVQATTSLSDLQRRLSDALTRGRPFDLLHLAAHGTRQGELLLEDLASEDACAVGAEPLADSLRSASPLFAVVTTACWGGTGAGLAARLAQRGIPQVVGMVSETPVDDALAFARGFYRALARHGIPGAVAAGRRSLLASRPESTAWSQVVHYDNVAKPRTRPRRAEMVAPPRRRQRDRAPAPSSGNTVRIIGSRTRDVAGRDIHGGRPTERRRHEQHD